MEIIAVYFGLHQHPLVDVQPDIVDYVITEHHFRLIDVRFHGGHLAVEVGVAVSVVLHDDLGQDTPSQDVVDGGENLV